MPQTDLRRLDGPVDHRIVPPVGKRKARRLLHQFVIGRVGGRGNDAVFIHLPDRFLPIYRGNQIIPGVREFIDWIQKENKKFLFLTNNSCYTPRELQQKLARMGLDVSEDHFYTSALATAAFLKEQAPGCSVYAIGEAALFNALYDAGITMNDINTVLPFGNTLYMVQVTGAELLEALEASTFSTPEPVGGFPQVAGIEFEVWIYRNNSSTRGLF